MRARSVKWKSKNLGRPVELAEGNVAMATMQKYADRPRLAWAPQ
jgi:hypothetical protein